MGPRCPLCGRVEGVHVETVRIDDLWIRQCECTACGYKWAELGESTDEDADVR